jgi:uncharacterized protein YecT (DUF1311 family)
MMIQYIGKVAISLSFISVCLSLSHQTVHSQQLNCTNSQTQLEMNQCAAKAAQNADRELNRVYKLVQAKYRGSRLEPQLVDAQLAWIRFRDLKCRFASNRYKGGSIAPMVYSRCLERTTRQQTDELKNYLKEG